MESTTRQELIRAAVSFLQNPSLLDSSLKDKLKFLKDKGLNEVEVDEALNLALINRYKPQGGRWNFLIVLGLFFGAFKVYQAYLKSKDDQQQATTKPSQKCNSTKLLLNNIDSQANKDQPTLTDILQRISELKRLLELQRSNFSSEVQSLKTLLLGHEKFAAPPMIPAWQLQGSDDKIDDEDQTKVNHEEEFESNKRRQSDKSKKNTPSIKNNGANSFTDNKPIEPTVD